MARTMYRIRHNEDPKGLFCPYYNTSKKGIINRIKNGEFQYPRDQYVVEQEDKFGNWKRINTTTQNRKQKTIQKSQPSG
jgi:hypothetical protein